MKEIKYRAWLGHVMIQVVSMDFIKDSRGEYEGLVTGYFLDGKRKGLRTSIETKSAILRQFTGLHDKNGTEIYEHDLLKHPNGIIAEIKFVPEHAAFLAHYSVDGNSKYDYLEGDGKMRYCEVVGNSFENPELLAKEATHE